MCVTRYFDVVLCPSSRQILTTLLQYINNYSNRCMQKCPGPLLVEQSEHYEDVQIWSRLKRNPKSHVSAFNSQAWRWQDPTRR